MLKITLLFFATSLGLVKAGGLDLPSYIPKCSLSDPKFSKCVVKAANEAIPILAKGDLLHNIQPVSPAFLVEAPVYATGLEYVLHNGSSSDWKNLVLTDALLDLKNGKATFVGNMHQLQVTAQNYTIIDGKILDIPVYGHGKHNMTLVGLKINFQGDLRLYKKGNDEYLDYSDFKVDAEVEEAFFYFENIKSPEKDDVNAYINDNGKNFFNQIKPAFVNYFNFFVNSRIKAILDGVPYTHYIPKCSLSDPELSKCFVQAANKAIPYIVTDRFYPFPSKFRSPLSPLKLPAVVILDNGDPKYTLYNVDVNTREKFVLTDAIVDFEKGNCSFVGVLDKIQVIAENYTITDGRILDIPVYGHGKHNFTIVGVTMHVHAILGIHRKGEDEYMHYFNATVDTRIEEGYFYFENLKSPENSDVNAYIKKNWNKLFEQVKPTLDGYAEFFMFTRITAITDVLPLSKIFLP